MDNANDDDDHSHLQQLSVPSPIPQERTLLSLPNELLIQTLQFLPGHDLALISRVNRRLHNLTSLPKLWSSLLFSLRIATPSPYESFKSLYGSLHPHLWLAPRLWHSDRRFSGLVVATRYNPSTGDIAIHQLLAPPCSSRINTWSHDPSVLVSTFTLTVKLWAEPLLTLSPFGRPDPDTGELTYPSNLSAVSTTLLRAVPIPLHTQNPNMALWPPSTLPAAERARNVSISAFKSKGHQPTSLSEACVDIFRLRKQLRYHPTHEMSQVETFSALQEEWYTPSPSTPLKGVWVGDYHLHGIEMVLFLQTAPHKLEAVKLTGDINVPRGEYTFVVDDLSQVLRIADEPEWPGAKIIKARGQIADQQFADPHFIDCEFIWISNDEAAFHWIFPGPIADQRISKFFRIDVDCFLFGEGLQKVTDDTDDETTDDV